MEGASTTLKQVLLIIFDGWGYSTETKYNAIATANPQFFNHLWTNYPHTLLKACGEAIGLPEGQIGTSEIGHTTIGSGAVIYTDLVKVNKAIADGTFCENEVLQKLFQHVKDNHSTLHLLGQVSPGGVHSHQDHLFALIRCAKKEGIEKVAVHVFTDGRDEPPMSEEKFVKQLEEVFQETGIGRVATMIGRYYAMDRDTNWDRTQKAVDMIFEGKGQQIQGKDPVDVLIEDHNKGTEDQYIEPYVFLNSNGEKETIRQNDGVFFFNFRPDRARQLTYKIQEKVDAMNLYFATLSTYDINLPTPIAYPKDKVKDTIAQEVSKAGLTQVHIGETEKFAHITYYLDGERNQPFPNETYELIPSRKVATHDMAPQMRAKEIADKTIEHIQKGTNLIAINFANADMVGHVGKFEPTVEAIKVLDVELKRVIEALLANGGVAFITADHGNAEHMYDEDIHQTNTAHTLNPVPGILTMQGVKLKEEGTLADVAPTILALFGIPKPSEMTGNDLIEK